MARGRTEALLPTPERSAHQEESEPKNSSENVPRSVPLSDLSAFRRDLLFVIASFEGIDTVPVGVAIAEDLRAVSTDSVTQGRFYQNLRDLVADDVVEKRPIDGRTNAYYLPSPTTEALATRVAWERECLATPENPDRERDCAESGLSLGLLRRWR